MKGTLKISIVGNLVLAALALWLARHAGMTTDSPRHSPTVSSVAAEPSAPAPWPRPEPGAFRWSQIESEDYRTYIANLRNIGCPEQTVRDIIMAEVHTLYAPRREELERKQSALESGPTMTGLINRQTLAVESQKLRNEEATLLSALLGSQSSGPDTGNISNPRTLRDRALDRIVAQPLVFQNVDPVAMKLDGRQIEVIDELRRKFQEDLGGPNRDPNGPAYRKRWQEAQRENDDMLAGMLGGQFYLDYQMQAENPSPQP